MVCGHVYEDVLIWGHFCEDVFSGVLIALGESSPWWLPWSDLWTEHYGKREAVLEKLLRLTAAGGQSKGHMQEGDKTRHSLQLATRR